VVFGSAVHVFWMDDRGGVDGAGVAQLIVDDSPGDCGIVGYED